MSSDLLDSLTRLLTPSFLDRVSVHFGESEGTVSKGLNAAFSTILGGLAAKAGSSEAFRPVVDFITDPANDPSVLDDPRQLLSMAPSAPIARLGANFLNALFGLRLSSLGQAVAGLVGIRGASGSSLLSFAASLVLGLLGNRLRTGSLDAAGLANQLLGQRDAILSAIPAGVSSVLGLDDFPPGSALRVDAPRGPELRRAVAGARWLWPALAALALLAMVCGFSRNRGLGSPVAVEDETSRGAAVTGAVGGPVGDVDAADSAAEVHAAPGAARRVVLSGLVRTCLGQVDVKLRRELAAGNVRYTSGRPQAVNPEVTNVQGEARVTMPGGWERSFTYFCSFLTREGGRLTRAEYAAAERPGGDGRVAPTALLRVCQGEIDRKLRRELGATSVWYPSGRPLAVNPEVTNVQGEARASLRRGPERQFTYLCSFLNQEGPRLETAEYSVK